MDTTVAIYERIKDEDGWHERHVPMPCVTRRSRGGYTLFAQDEREGKFLISWYENCEKMRQTVKGRLLSRVVKLARFNFMPQHLGRLPSAVMACTLLVGPESKM